jgi:hypothetical protein
MKPLRVQTPAKAPPPAPMQATDGEKRNGFTDETIDEFFKGSMTPWEYWAEAVRRSSAREQACFAALTQFKSHYDMDDLSVGQQKQLDCIRLDLARAIDARKHAQARLEDLA